MEAKPNILEPVMKVEVTVPHEFQVRSCALIDLRCLYRLGPLLVPPQGMGISLLNKRKGQLTGSETGDMGVVIEADVPLSQMFGFSTDLRSGTQVSKLLAEALASFTHCLHPPPFLSRRAKGKKVVASKIRCCWPL